MRPAYTRTEFTLCWTGRVCGILTKWSCRSLSARSWRGIQLISDSRVAFRVVRRKLILGMPPHISSEYQGGAKVEIRLGGMAGYIARERVVGPWDGHRSGRLMFIARSPLATLPFVRAISPINQPPCYEVANLDFISNTVPHDIRLEV